MTQTSQGISPLPVPSREYAAHPLLPSAFGTLGYMGIAGCISGIATLTAQGERIDHDLGLEPLFSKPSKLMKNGKNCKTIFLKY